MCPSGPSDCKDDNALEMLSSKQEHTIKCIRNCITLSDSGNSNRTAATFVGTKHFHRDILNDKKAKTNSNDSCAKRWI